MTLRDPRTARSVSEIFKFFLVLVGYVTSYVGMDRTALSRTVGLGPWISGADSSFQKKSQQRLEVNKYRASRTQKRTIRNLNNFLNGTHFAPCKNESVAVDRTKPVTLQETPSNKIQEPKIQTVIPSETLSEPDVNLNEIKSGIKKDENIPKRHSSSKKRQQRIERRIAKGKPFQRGPPPGEQEPKNVETRLGENIQIIHKSKTEFTLKGSFL